jgi:hypothetical protein
MKKLSWMLFWGQVRREFAPAIFMLALATVIVAFYLNAGASSTVEVGTVIKSMITPGQYSATNTIVVAQIGGGRVVEIHTLSSAKLFAPGATVKVRRLKRVFFGEYFMLAE